MERAGGDRSAGEGSKRRGGLISWFADNHVAVNILMAFVIIAGLIVVSSMVKEIFPTIDPKTITITVPYPGASAANVEDGITRRVEEAIIGVQGVKRVTSTANEGLGSIIAEIEDFADTDDVLTDVETEVGALQDFPPEQAEEAQVMKTKVTPPVMTLAVYGAVSEETLNSWAEQIESELLDLPGVSLTAITGNRPREIAINISENTLRKYGLNLNAVADQIRSHSIDVPAGNVKTAAAEILVRIDQKNDFGYQYEDIPLKSDTTGRILRLGDIAEISDGFIADRFVNQYEGEPAVFVAVNRSPSQDTVVLRDQVYALVSQLQLPEQVNVAVWKDETNILKDRINLLTRNAIMGLTLVFLSLVIFLDLRLAFWTSVGIAISFLGGLAVASLFGVTMNMITLFALIVVLGVVVDDAIVTGESIFSAQTAALRRKAGEEAGADLAPELTADESRRATLSGVAQILAPVTIGVLTTVCAFAPLLLSSGTLGQILRTIPIIVISILLMSLLEAYFILPAHLSSSKRWSKGLLAELRVFVNERLELFISKVFIPVLSVLLDHRIKTILSILLIVLGSFALLKFGAVDFVFFPNIESDELTVELEMPVGTPYAQTEQRINQVLVSGQKVFTKYNSASQREFGSDVVKNTVVTIGGRQGLTGGPDGLEANSVSSHLAQVQIKLVPSAQRAVSTAQIEKEWQSSVGNLPGVRKLAFESSLVKSKADLNIQLMHRRPEFLEAAGEELKNAVKKIPGIYEVVDSSEAGKLEYLYELNDLGIASGLTPALLGFQLRSAFYGNEIQRIQRGKNELKVMLRLTEAERNSFAGIENYRITLPDGSRAALSDIAEQKLDRSTAAIIRVDGRRVIQVTGDVDDDVLTPDQAITQIFSEIIPGLETQYPGLSASVEGESKDQKNDLISLGRNMLIAVFLIFVLLAAQLRSYVKPLIILSTIPLGIAGAILGHFFFGYNLSFISLFGIVALAGVVVNDSVVLVDYYNTIRSQFSAKQAILEATARRFRPILLTTMTTSLGLLPMLLETSLQARFIIPMAVSLGCGVLFASVLLIVLVPTLLYVFEQAAARLGASTH